MKLLKTKHAGTDAQEVVIGGDPRVGRRAPEGPAKLFGEVVRGWTVPKRGTISHLVIGGRLAEGSLARSTCGAKIDSYPLRDALPAGCRPCGTCQRHHEAHLGPVT